MTQDQLDLLHGYLNGTIDEAGFAGLQALLREKADARSMLRSLSTVEAKLNQLAAVNPDSVRLLAQPALKKKFSARWFSWRPLTAAAAGLLIGLFSASVVFGFVVQRRAKLETVLDEGFEDARMRPLRRFPREANRWFGDLSVPIGAADDMKPAKGGRMVRLPPEPKRKLSYARRIVDLAEHPEVAAAKSVRLEVAASFNTPEFARPAHYQIRLAAFAEAPSDVGGIWGNEPVLFDTVLEHVGRNVKTQPEDGDWSTVHTSIQIPPGTRSILISLGAGGADPAQSQAEHYLDDVKVRFFVQDTAQE